MVQGKGSLVIGSLEVYWADEYWGVEGWWRVNRKEEEGHRR